MRAFLILALIMAFSVQADASNMLLLGVGGQAGGGPPPTPCGATQLDFTVACNAIFYVIGVN